MNARDFPAVIGWSLVAMAAVVYWLCARQFDAGRSDFYYLADAFLHGRTWLESRRGRRRHHHGSRHYVPFAPFPAIAAMPLIALVGPEAADRSEPTSTRSWPPPRWAVLVARRPARRVAAP